MGQLGCFLSCSHSTSGQPPLFRKCVLNTHVSASGTVRVIRPVAVLVELTGELEPRGGDMCGTATEAAGSGGSKPDRPTGVC